MSRQRDLKPECRCQFDPLGFLDGKSQDEVYRLREAELAHSRVAMLASLGFIVQERIHPLFSGDGGPAIEQIPKLPIWVGGVMLSGIGFAEQTRIAKGWAKLDPQTQTAATTLRPGYYPGDLGFDPANIRPKDPTKLRIMQERRRGSRISMARLARWWCLQCSLPRRSTRKMPIQCPGLKDPRIQRTQLRKDPRPDCANACKWKRSC